MGVPAEPLLPEFANGNCQPVQVHSADWGTQPLMSGTKEGLLSRFTPGARPSDLTKGSVAEPETDPSSPDSQPNHRGIPLPQQKVPKWCCRRGTMWSSTNTCHLHARAGQRDEAGVVSTGGGAARAWASWSNCLLANGKSKLEAQVD